MVMQLQVIMVIRGKLSFNYNRPTENRTTPQLFVKG